MEDTFNVGAAYQAALKWIAGGGAQGRARTLPPWDEMAWFETPTITAVRTVASDVVPLCTVNSRRVVLVLAVANAIIANVGPISMPTGFPNFGITLSSAIQPLIITQKEHGPLCQVDWYATSGFAIDVTVIEVLLRDWPKDR